MGGKRRKPRLDGFSRLSLYHLQHLKLSHNKSEQVSLSTWCFLAGCCWRRWRTRRRSDAAAPQLARLCWGSPRALSPPPAPGICWTGLQGDAKQRISTGEETEPGRQSDGHGSPSPLTSVESFHGALVLLALLLLALAASAAVVLPLPLVQQRLQPGYDH